MQNEKENINQLKQAAENGQKSAQKRLGMMYLDEKSVVGKNLEEALKWLIKAYKQGGFDTNADADEILALANLYSRKGQLANADPNKAIQLYSSLIEKNNDAQAKYELGIMFCRKEATKQEVIIGRNLLLEVITDIEIDNLPSNFCMELGDVFSTGRAALGEKTVDGYPEPSNEDLRIAEKCFKRVIESGNLPTDILNLAQQYLGLVRKRLQIRQEVTGTKIEVKNLIKRYAGNEQAREEMDEEMMKVLNDCDNYIRKIEDAIFGGGWFSSNTIKDDLNNRKAQEKLIEWQRRQLQENHILREVFGNTVSSYPTGMSFAEKKDFYIKEFDSRLGEIRQIKDVLQNGSFPRNERIQSMRKRCEKCEDELRLLKNIVQTFY